jgi:uncharacterized protein involved in tolerance to divalent cations
MSYHLIVKGKTKEEALEKAKEEVAKLDPYRQPSIWAPVQKGPEEWSATVHYYGLD